MEIYRESSDIVETKIYQAGSLTDPSGNVDYSFVDLSDNTVVDSGTATQESTGVFSYTIGPTYTQSAAKYRIDWSYTLGGNSYSPSDHVQVVTPYTRPGEIKSRFSDLSSKTDYQLRNMERIARYIINNYCSRQFDYWANETKYVYGQGTKSLQLPERLIALDKLEWRDANLSIYIEGWDDDTYDDGWTVNSEWILPPSYSISRRTQLTFDQKLAWDRDTYFELFDHRKMFKVTGDWGWLSVPGQVNESALLLINDYFCKDSKWYERYVEEVSSGEWELSFAGAGSGSTGNAYVDSMLKSRRDIGLAVI